MGITPFFNGYAVGTFSNGVFTASDQFSTGSSEFLFTGDSIDVGGTGNLLMLGPFGYILNTGIYTYDGYYNSDGVQYPLIHYGTRYDLLGQPPYKTTLTSFPITAATYNAPCYTTGTLIRTIRGDVPVEHLNAADLVVTAGGEHRPVRWLGHRTLDPCRLPDPLLAQPIRIRAHALGEGRPSRDLVVSPGHSVCVDLLGEVLVPAGALVNGATIVRENVDTVTYWHVELDSHDLLLAEGLAAESYLDMGNRGFFAGEGVVALAATPDAPGPALRTHADFCRPFHDAGPLVAFLRERLRERAILLGWQLADDPWADGHLLVDGLRVDGERRGLQARFILPAEAREVWLVSGASVPDKLGLSDDKRQLGLCLAGLQLDDGWCEPRRVAVDDPLLCAGFHAVSNQTAGPHRWTAGRARLPAALWAGCDGPVTLRVDLAGPALPHWVARDTAAEPHHLSEIAAAA